MNMMRPPHYAGWMDSEPGPLLDLPLVTTITADDRTDCTTIQQLADIVKWHRRIMKPAKEVVMSGARPDVGGIEWVKLPKWKDHSGLAYSLWCQKELVNCFSTPFVLIWQSDGFALNSKFWRNEFLNYDYIGAPFSFDRSKVGNGGFCLRSKKFCERVRELPDCPPMGEDSYFCLHKREELVAGGIRFAPLNIAETWSVDCRPAVPRTFGFHGKDLMSRTVRRTRV